MKDRNYIRLSRPKDYSGEFRSLDILGITVDFSYEEPIAYRDWTGPQGDFARQKNHWGPTTGKHLKRARGDCLPGIEDRDEFHRRLNACIAKRAMALCVNGLAPEEGPSD